MSQAIDPNGAKNTTFCSATPAKKVKKQQPNPSANLLHPEYNLNSICNNTQKII